MASKVKPKPAVTLADLHGDPKNARKHNPRNIGQVQNSLQKYGAARSIVIDEDNQIIAGHGVVEAAAMAGIERVQVVEADGETIIAVRRTGLTKKQKQALGIADNRAGDLSEWDTDRLAELMGDIDLGDFFTADELAELMPDLGGNDAEDPGAQVDKAAELQAKWGTALGQLWAIGRHRLLVGDCTVAENVARLMGGEKAQCMWTDPPYGVEYVGKTKDALTIENDGSAGLLDLLTGAFAQADGAMNDGASFYIAAPPGPQSHTFTTAIVGTGWKWHETLAWVKNSMVLGHSDYHYKHEIVFYGWKGKNRAWYGGRDQVSVFEVDRPSKSEEHPTMKPSELVERMLVNSTGHADIVLDPFCGSGTTLVACEKLGRIGRGMELSPAYAAVTLQRLADMGLTPERVDA